MSVKPCPITTHGTEAADTSGRYQLAAIVSPADGKQISEQDTDRAACVEAPVIWWGFRISLSSGAGITNVQRDAHGLAAGREPGNDRDALTEHDLIPRAEAFGLQLDTILAYELIDQQPGRAT